VQGSGAVAVAAAAAAAVAPRPVAAAGSIELAQAGSVTASAAAAAAPPVAAPPVKPVVVVKAPEVRRSPVVLASSADGVVVQRNVVINVGGAAQPLTGPGTRAARPRTSVPYVVREGSYPLPPGQLERTPSERAIPAEARRTRTPVALAPERAAAERASFGADLVTDKSLDEVILEYLSDDGETEER
jgi:hypothetical protein